MKNNHLIYKLLAQKTITQERFKILQAQTNPDRIQLLFYLFLGLGFSFLISGLLFFIASNWAVIPAAVKLIGVQSLLILFILLAWRLQTHARLFHLFVFSSSILVGLNLAVFGQVYQTGADAYTLFATWTLLITFWAWSLKLPILFILWQALLYFSLILAYSQFLRPFDIISSDNFGYIFILITHLILLISLLQKGHTLFLYKPNTIVILLASLITVLIPAIDEIFMHDKNSLFFILFILQGGLLFAYFYKQKQILELSVILLSALIFIEFVLIKNILSLHSTESFLIFGMLSILLTLGLGNILKRIHLSFKKSLS